MLLLVFISLLSGLCLINGERTKVTVKKGENAVLPFSVNTTLKVKELKVVWTHWEHGEKTVLTYKYGRNYSGDQDKQFQGRVFFFEEEIPKGNVSLRLTNVTQPDAGNYTCLVTYHDLPEDQKHCSVRLDVKEGGKPSESTGSDTTTKPPETQTDKTNAIIGGVCGGVAVLIVAVIAIIGYKRYRGRQFSNNVNIGLRNVAPYND